MNSPLPTVSSEGGPILVGDYERIRKWKGVEDGGADYSLACSQVAASNVNAIDDHLLVWDFGGPGTGHVLFRDEAFTLIRTWADKEMNDAVVLQLSKDIAFQPTETRLFISSGIVVFLWAPENGSSIESLAGQSGTPPGDFSMGGTVHFQRAQGGTFQVHSAQGRRGDIEFTAIKLIRA